MGGTRKKKKTKKKKIIQKGGNMCNIDCDIIEFIDDYADYIINEDIIDDVTTEPEPEPESGPVDMQYGGNIDLYWKDDMRVKVTFQTITPRLKEINNIIDNELKQHDTNSQYIINKDIIEEVIKLLSVSDISVSNRNRQLSRPSLSDINPNMFVNING